MGYACPVCADPQADGEHLANHLAFTAMLGDADHEDWLDEHAPDWGDTDPAELADRVTDLAEEREFPQVFEDTTDDGHGHDDHTHDHSGHGHGQSGHTHGGVPDGVASGGVADPSELFDESGAGRDGSSSGANADSEPDPADVLAEARELTERRRSSGDDEGAGTNEADADEE